MSDTTTTLREPFNIIEARAEKARAIARDLFRTEGMDVAYLDATSDAILEGIMFGLESAQPVTTTTQAPDGVRTMHPRKLAMACRHLANGYAFEMRHTHGIQGVIGQPGMPNVAYRVQVFEAGADALAGRWVDAITVTLHGSVLTHPALDSRTPKTREQLMLAAEQLAANESALTYLANVPL